MLTSSKGPLPVTVPGPAYPGDIALVRADEGRYDALGSIISDRGILEVKAYFVVSAVESRPDVGNTSAHLVVGEYAVDIVYAEVGRTEGFLGSVS